MAKNKEEQIGNEKTMLALSFWHSVTATALHKMPLDLSSRQTAILFHIYLMAEPQSIKLLAQDLLISKPAICRAVDALENVKLLKRVRDKTDKRNVILQRTVKGSAYLEQFADIIISMSKETP